jgi:hypothetical protein
MFRWRRLVRFPVAVMVALLAIEALLRVDWVAHLLPPPTQFYQPAVPKRLDALRHVQASAGGVDILFIGSSIIRTNISPLEFDAVVRRRLGVKVVSFNAGLSGLWPSAVEMYFRELWLERAHPAVVMQGIRFPELVASSFAADEDVLGGTVERRWYRNGPLDRLEWRLLDNVHLLQYRGAVGLWLRKYADRTLARDEDARWAIDARGFTHRGPLLRVMLASGRLAGERPHAGDLDPDRNRVGFAAIRRTAELCRRAGVRYVLVNVPEFAFRWSASDGADRYARYLDTVRRFAAANGIEFIDVTGGRADAFADPDEYSDYHHMSPAGAARFTCLLADHLVEHDAIWVRALGDRSEQQRASGTALTSTRAARRP